MDSQQIVDYIAEQLKAGHSEAVLREHMVGHGWSGTAVDDAFKRYHAAHPKHEDSAKTEVKLNAHQHKAAKAPRRGARVGLKRSKVKGAVAIVVIVGLLAGGLFIFHKQTTKPSVPVVRQPTFQQRQSLDTITLGGAVGQYVDFNNKTLPAKVAPAPDGTNSVVLCGSVCDPATWQVASLSAYKPAGVKMLPYSAYLTVADTESLYLVSGARCDQQGVELSLKNVKPLSMSILYATKEASVLKQHCVIL
jgi:hypothetical protein